NLTCQFIYQKVKCQHDGKCLIKVTTRKQCTRCRLERCFRIGMKKELISLRKNCKNAIILKRELQMEGKRTIGNAINLLHINSCELKRIDEVQEAMSIFPDESTAELVGQAKSLIDAL